MLRTISCLIFFVFVTASSIDLNAQVNDNALPVNQNKYPERAFSMLEEARERNKPNEEVLKRLLDVASDLENIGQYPNLLAQIYAEIFERYRFLRKPHLGTPFLTKIAELIHQFGTNEEDWIKVKADFFAKRAYSLYWDYMPDEAIIEMQKAVKFYKQLNNDFKIGVCLNGLGVYHSELGDSEKSIEYYDEAFTYFEKSDDETWMLRSKFCKSVDLVALKKHEEAKQLLLDILPRLEATKHVNYKFSISKLGQIEMELSNFEEAEKLMLQSLDWGIESNNHNSIVTTSEKLVTLYEKKQDHANESKYLKLITNHQDSLLAQINDEKNKKAQEQLEVLEQKQIIKELEFQKQLDQQKFQNRLFYTIAFFSFLLAILGFGIYTQRAKRKQATQLQSKVEEVQRIRENLLSAITHELRTPLTLIVGQIEELQKRKLDKADQVLTQKLDKNASDLLRQINQLLDWKRTEAQAMELNTGLGDVAGLLKEQFQSVRSNFENKNLEWSYDIFPEKLTVELDFEKLKIIVNNLLRNAAKYTPEGGKIKLRMKLSKEDELSISVEDNGIGIAIEMQDKIFNWYQRAQQHGMSQSNGFGVGLALSKQLSQIMNGSLDFESRPGKGSTFTLSLPIIKLSSSEVFGANVIPASEQKTIKSDDRTSCLIVEDHQELNEYLKRFLTENYVVYSALDAETGMDLAAEYLPDIIISDQMLPGKSGLELCKELKEHILTDHIPIIILTALNNEDTHHSALINRADAFMTKPFKQEELLLTINNLIQNRRRLKIRFQKNDPIVKLKKDDPFIKLMISNIESNYKDCKFNVDALAKSLKISRAQLTKKSKALIDSTPSALIKKHRLDQAKKMLEQGNVSVSETAYDNGFSSPEYFSTVFKDYFKQSPKDFLKRDA